MITQTQLLTSAAKSFAPTRAAFNDDKLPPAKPDQVSFKGTTGNERAKLNDTIEILQAINPKTVIEADWRNTFLGLIQTGYIETPDIKIHLGYETHQKVNTEAGPIMLSKTIPIFGNYCVQIENKRTGETLNLGDNDTSTLKNKDFKPLISAMSGLINKIKSENPDALPDKTDRLLDDALESGV